MQNKNPISINIQMNCILKSPLIWSYSHYCTKVSCIPNYLNTSHTQCLHGFLSLPACFQWVWSKYPDLYCKERYGQVSLRCLMFISAHTSDQQCFPVAKEFETLKEKELAGDTAFTALIAVLISEAWRGQEIKISPLVRIQK